MAWVCEDNPQISANGATVVITDGDYFSQNRPLNAYYKPASGAIESGTHFWEFQFKLPRGYGWVGLTTETLFAPGYDFKGLVYGNNLSDGGQSLIANFGEAIVDGDKVGLLVEMTNDALKVYLYHNNHPLGMAFDIPKPYPKPVFPAIQLENPGEVTIAQVSTIPTEKTRKPFKYAGVAGDWKQDHCELDSKIDENSRSWDVRLNALPGGFRKYGPTPVEMVNATTYYLNFQIVNTRTARLEKQNNKWTIVPGSSTLIGTQDNKAKEAEEFLVSILTNFKDLSLNNDLLSFESSKNKKMVLKRFEKPNPLPVTKNPIEE